MVRIQHLQPRPCLELAGDLPIAKCLKSVSAPSSVGIGPSKPLSTDRREDVQARTHRVRISTNRTPAHPLHRYETNGTHRNPIAPSVTAVRFPREVARPSHWNLQNWKILSHRHATSQVRLLVNQVQVDAFQRFERKCLQHIEASI